MDPDANLKEQLALARSILANDDAGISPDDGECVRLSELVIALHEWLRTGGMLPHKWSNSQK